jgi:hypothetical protein
VESGRPDLNRRPPAPKGARRLVRGWRLALERRVRARPGPRRRVERLGSGSLWARVAATSALPSTSVGRLQPAQTYPAKSGAGSVPSRAVRQDRPKAAAQRCPLTGSRRWSYFARARSVPCVTALCLLSVASQDCPIASRHEEQRARFRADRSLQAIAKADAVTGTRSLGRSAGPRSAYAKSRAGRGWAARMRLVRGRAPAALPGGQPHRCEKAEGLTRACGADIAGSRGAVRRATCTSCWRRTSLAPNAPARCQ